MMRVQPDVYQKQIFQGLVWNLTGKVEAAELKVGETFLITQKNAQAIRETACAASLLHSSKRECQISAITENLFNSH